MRDFTCLHQPTKECIARLTIPETIFRHNEIEEILSKVSAWVSDITNGTIKSIQAVDLIKAIDSDFEPRGIDFCIDKDDYRIVSITTIDEDNVIKEANVCIWRIGIEFTIVEVGV